MDFPEKKVMEIDGQFFSVWVINSPGFEYAQELGGLTIYGSMLNIIIQVKGSEESFAYLTRNFAFFYRRHMVKGNSLAQGIDYNVAILAIRNMALDLFT
jgi:hypothetical protein